MMDEDIGRLQVVVEDLEYIQNDWDQEIDDASLRRTSTVLRRLLVDEDLRRTWRFLGFPTQPLVKAPSLEALLKGIPFERVRFAQAGGATYHGVEVRTPMEVDGAVTPEDLHARLSDPAVDHVFSIRKFTDSPAFVVRGERIARREVVQYVAHKLGGAHFDARRSAKKESERRFLLLDGVVEERYIAADKRSVYFELLSIGQALVASPDVKKLVAAGRRVLSSADA